MNLLDRIRMSPGGLDSVGRIIKLTVYVASARGFTEQSFVADGASEFLVEVFGHAGRHARAAIGVAALPLGSPVEVDAVVLIDSDWSSPDQSNAGADAGRSS